MTTVRAPLRRAEVIAIGSELLGWTRLDTNSLFIAERLSALGIELRAKAVVGDNRDDIGGMFAQARARADLLILTGGLGPTDDDLTREAVAMVLGRALREEATIVEAIARRFARRGMRMPEVNRRQAMVVEGATVLDNPNGTAPGQMIEDGDRVVLLLPGPPRELQPMLIALCEGPLARRAAGEGLFRRSLFIAGRSESHVEETVQPIYSKWRDSDPPIETTILATPGQIELHLTMRSPDPVAALATLDAAHARLVAALGEDVFSTDGRSMEEVVGARLLEGRLTIAAAESCTGGLLMSRLTDVPGSSAYVLAGAVVYSNESKTALVDVPESLIRSHGAVSEPVAVALAEGIKDKTGASIAVGITGIAGPSGGTPQKPVGTVAVAVIAPGGAARVRTFSFPGGRAQVKFHATQAALDMVRRTIA
jgi:nicotinamide-nucleotide amidase